MSLASINPAPPKPGSDVFVTDANGPFVISHAVYTHSEVAAMAHQALDVFLARAGHQGGTITFEIVEAD